MDFFIGPFLIWMWRHSRFSVSGDRKKQFGCVGSRVTRWLYKNALNISQPIFYFINCSKEKITQSIALLLTYIPKVCKQSSNRRFGPFWSPWLEVTLQRCRIHEWQGVLTFGGILKSLLKLLPLRWRDPARLWNSVHIRVARCLLILYTKTGKINQITSILL
jgi:hypothetical protein